MLYTKEMLKQSIQNVFSSKCDEHFEHSIDDLIEDMEKKGYEVSYDIVNEGDWISNGKNELMDNALVEITVDGNTFYLGVSQTCSKGEDPYFDEAEIRFLKTKEEYNKPKKITDFIFNNQTIVILSDKSAKIGKQVFPTVEEAVKSLL